MNDSTAIDPKVFKITDFGLAACYFGSEICDDQEIKYVEELIKNYKNNIKLKEGQKINDNLFSPRFYKCWGHFSSMCVLLVDDFNFASRIFQPHSHLVEDDFPHKSFINQSQTLILPELNNNSTANFNNWKYTDKYKFIANVNIKISDNLTEGTGISVLFNFINEVNEKLNIPYPSNKNAEIVFFPSLSFSWNEITLFIFSDDLDLLNNKIIEILDIKLEKNENEGEFVRAVQFSQSVFGYNQKVESEFHSLSFNAQFNMKIFLKHGCFSEAFLILNDSFKDKTVIREIIQKARVLVGKGDMGLFNLNIMEYFTIFLRLLEISREKKFFNKTYTYVHFPIYNPLNENLEYSDIDQNPEKCTEVKQNKNFTHDDINHVYKQLKNQRVGNSVRDRIVKLYIKYNHAVEDKVMGRYFLSLHAILDVKRKDIINCKMFEDNNFDIADYTKDLMRFSEIIEKAFFNRYGTSYDMDEVPDWNIDFSGGYQQLVLAYDFSYKSLTKLLGEWINPNNSKPSSFMYLAGHQGQKSNSYSVRLNAFHIYHPELFANVAVHEASNFLFKKLKNYEISDLLSEKFADLKEEIEDELSIVTKEWIRYQICDYLTLLTVFPNDFDNFTYWLFGTMLSDPNIYDKNRIIDDSISTEYLIRFLLVCYRSGQASINLKSFEKFLKTIPQLYNFWIIGKDIIQHNAKEIFKKYNISEIIIILDQIVLMEQNPEIIETVEDNTTNKIEKLLGKYRKKKKKYVQDLKKELLSGNLELNRHIYEVSKFQSFYEVTSIFGAMLSTFKDKDNYDFRNKNHKLMAWRSMKENKDGELYTNVENDVLIDEIGGVCIFNSEKRRKFFKIRSNSLLLLLNNAKRHFDIIY